MPSAKSRNAWLWARCAISCPSIISIANGHSMTSMAAITARPAYQPRRGCGRWVAPRDCSLGVLRRRVAVWRRLRGRFVSTTLSAFISPRLPPSRRRADHGLRLLVSRLGLTTLTEPSASSGRRPPLVLERVSKAPVRRQRGRTRSRQWRRECPPVPGANAGSA